VVPDYPGGFEKEAVKQVSILPNDWFRDSVGNTVKALSSSA